jgi:hypothetical protein
MGHERTLPSGAELGSAELKPQAFTARWRLGVDAEISSCSGVMSTGTSAVDAGRRQLADLDDGRISHGLENVLKFASHHLRLIFTLPPLDHSRDTPECCGSSAQQSKPA